MKFRRTDSKVQRNWGRRLRLAALLLLMVLLVSSALVAVYGSQRAPVESSDQSAPQWVAARSSIDHRQFEATAIGVFEEGKQLFSASDGLVTSVAVESGQTVRDGSIVLWVDGYPVVAVETAVPFWRAFESGSRGDDVTALQEFLERRGAFESEHVDGIYGANTRAAWNEYMIGFGIDPANSRAPAPRDFVWVSNPIVADAVEVSPGLTIQAGTVITGEAPSLQAVEVIEPADVPAAGEAAWVVEIDGVTTKLDRSVGRVTLLDLGSHDIDPETEHAASVMLETGEEVWVVPASALITKGSVTCIYGRAASDVKASNQIVQVLGGGLGAAFISEITAAEVLANPASSGQDLSCQG